jgi:hypothetical protein
MLPVEPWSPEHTPLFTQSVWGPSIAHPQPAVTETPAFWVPLSLSLFISIYNRIYFCVCSFLSFRVSVFPLVSYSIHSNLSCSFISFVLLSFKLCFLLYFFVFDSLSSLISPLSLFNFFSSFFASCPSLHHYFSFYRSPFPLLIVTFVLSILYQ